MLIRLRLLSFLIACTIAANIAANAYADNEQNPAKFTPSEPAQTANTTTPAAPTESSEPTAFDPIELPKPVMTERAPLAPTALASTTLAPTTVTKAEAPPKPVKNKAVPIPKLITPKVIVIKSDAVAHPVAINGIAMPGNATTLSQPRVKSPEQIKSLELQSQQMSEPQEAEIAPQNTDASSPTYINASAVPITESVKTSVNQCANATNNHFQKSLLVMAFPRLIPTSSNAGELYQVEQQLPQLLSQLLVSKRSTINPEQLNQALPTSDSSSEAQLSQLTQRLASDHRSQFILSGEIVDMSMTTPDATYNPAFYTRAINKFFDVIEAKNRFDKRDRLFSFQLHLRDGFTGQELLSKRYDTYGIWGFTGKVSFGSPLFWKSDYGQQIKSLVNVAAKDLSTAINCQPFIAQIDSRPGQTQFILQSGSNNGLHTGDMLTLYQMIIQGSETRYQEHDVRLVNRNIAIELREVYASHSVGVISGTPYLTGQLLAVAP